MNLPATTDTKNQDDSLWTKRLSRRAEEIERYTFGVYELLVNLRRVFFTTGESGKCGPREFMRAHIRRGCDPPK